jgi:inhibitor of cysteine peptidase
MSTMKSQSLAKPQPGPWRALGALVAGVFVATALQACGGATSPDEFSDPNVPIHVAAGRDFALRLESSISTGHNWRLAQPLDAAVLALVSSRYDEEKSSLVGAPGAETWTFRAVARGQTTINLEYVQPWATGQAPARTASFSVTVE